MMLIIIVVPLSYWKLVKWSKDKLMIERSLVWIPALDTIFKNIIYLRLNWSINMSPLIAFLQAFEFTNWNPLLRLRYPDDKYPTRVNYYSNQEVSMPIEGNSIPTGNAETNNAAVLTQTRFVMESIGKEDSTCPAGWLYSLLYCIVMQVGDPNS